MNINKIKNILKDNISYIKRTYFVADIGLFGSFAKGTQKEDSDIDILVSFEKGHKDFFNYIRLKYYLEGLLKRKVDLVIKEALKSGLRQKILDEVINVQ